MSEKRAPVQGYTPGIPWEMHLRAYDVYCEKYGGQKALIDLGGRNCRGGFSTGELDDFIPGWREELSDRKAMQGEIASLRSQLAETRVKAIEECAKVAERWKSSLRPGTEARRLGHEEAAREIAAELRALSPTTLAQGAV